MKFIAVLLSIYTIFLACLTCADARVNNTSQCSISKSEASDHHEDDVCSPFCICSCCGSQVISQIDETFFSFRQFLFVSDKIISVAVPVFISGFFGSFWQPPKISEI
jgi:hypothetical protein